MLHAIHYPVSPSLSDPGLILPRLSSDSQSLCSPYDALDPSWNPRRPGSLRAPVQPMINNHLTPPTPSKEAFADVARMTSLAVSNVSPCPRNPLLTASPRLGHAALLKRSKIGSHQRQVSVESTSTVTIIGESDMVEEDDDDNDDTESSAISMDLSNHGDDELSLAGSTESEVGTAQQAMVTRTNSIKKVDARQGRPSSAELSRRAEHILASAKRRLDNMEGNLNRARSSLAASPRSGSSPGATMSLTGLSPAVSGPDMTSYGSPIREEHLVPRMFHRNPAVQARVFSERSQADLNQPALASSRLMKSVGTCDSVDEQTVFTFHPEEETSHNVCDSVGRDVVNSFHSPIPQRPRPNVLETLVEVETGSIYGSAIERPASSETSNLPILSSEPKRTSSLQIQALTDKMNSLKDRISSLKSKAKQDTRQRLSMQYSRTLSTFTAAKSWRYSEGYRLHEISQIDALRMERSFRVYSEPGPADDTAQTDTFITRTGLRQDDDDPQNHDIRNAALGHSLVEENAAVQDPADYAELAGAYNGPDEANDMQIDPNTNHNRTLFSLSHEDRADAFYQNYEGFFLRKAMSHQSLQPSTRSLSFSSESSVATARNSTTGVHHTLAPAKSNFHTRSKTEDSVTTMASFATAQEGYATSEYDNDTDNVHHDIAAVSTLSPSTPPPRDIQPTASEITPTATTKRSTFGSPFEKHFVPQHELSSLPTPSPIMAMNRDVERLTARLAHRPSTSSLTSSASTGSRSFPLGDSAGGSGSGNCSGVTTPLGVGEITHSSSSSSSSLRYHSPNTAQRDADGRADGGSGTKDVCAWGQDDGKTGIFGAEGSKLAALDEVLVRALMGSVDRCVRNLYVRDGGEEDVADMEMWRARLRLARKVLEGEVPGLL